MTSWRSYVFLFAFMCMIDCTEGDCYETLSKLGVSSEGLEKKLTVMNTKPKNMLACSLRHACPKEENTTYCHLLYYCILDKNTSEFPLESCKGSSSKNVTLHYIGCVIAQIRNYNISGCDDYEFIFEVHSKMLRHNKSDPTTLATTTTATTTTTTPATTTATTTTATTATTTATATTTTPATPATLATTTTTTQRETTAEKSTATTLAGTTVNTPQSATAPTTLPETTAQTKIATETSPSVATTLVGAIVNTSQLTATPAPTTLSGMTTQTKIATETSPSVATTLVGTTVNTSQSTATPAPTTLSGAATQTKTTAVVTSIKTSRTTTTHRDTSSARATLPPKETTTTKVQPRAAANATCTCSHPEATNTSRYTNDNPSSNVDNTGKNVMAAFLMVSLLLNAIMLAALLWSRKHQGKLQREQSMTFTEMHDITMEDPPPPLYPNDRNGEGSHLMQVRVADTNGSAAVDPLPSTYGNDNNGEGSRLLQTLGCCTVTLKSTGEAPSERLAANGTEHQEPY